MIQVLGRVRPVFAGEYNPLVAYSAVTIVTHGINTYQSAIDVPAGNAPDVANTPYWFKISQRGIDGEPGPEGPQGPPGPSLLPAGFEAWWPGTAAPAGWLDESIYHAQLPRATYPELWAMALASGNLLDEASWIAQVTAHGSCGAFSTGDGINTFRIPLLRRVYIRARDPQTGDLQVGQYQEDAQQRVTASLKGVNRFENVFDTAEGAVTFGDKITTAQYVSRTPATDVGLVKVIFDNALQVRTADEVRVKTIVRLPIIKAFDTVQNPAMIEVSGLVTQLGMTNDRIAVSQQVMHVQDQKALGNAGGTFTAGAWRVRDLNTIITNSIPGASLANNQITLPAGKYFIDASAPALLVAAHKLRIASTDSSIIFYGQNNYNVATTAIASLAWVSKEITITSSLTFELQHYATNGVATNGFGAVSNVGTHETFAEIKIWRISQ